MMEFASRPLIRPPSTASFHPLHILRSASTSTIPPSTPTLPLPRPSSFGQIDYSIRPSDPRSFVHTTIPPITHAKDSIRGLRTPPCEMTTADTRPPLSQSNSHSYFRPFDNPMTSAEVSRSLESFRSTSQLKQSYRQPTSPSRRISVYNAQAQEPPQPTRRRNSTVRSGASMTVPASINSSKVPIADFAAQVTCLFWFESASLLHTIAESTIPVEPSPLQPLARHAVPEVGFRKWVTTVLSTTQVSQNVILLALLFVHRLKKLNPSVQGKPGSEFRLFTVALMLGNKYLDDNTYTNKTWAEVSGINVQEIHIMEVEFLSNMRYSLYVGDMEWKNWHMRLGRYWAYWDKASRLPLAPSPSLHNISTFRPTIPPPLPSPPASNSASPPFTYSHPPPAPAPSTTSSSHSLFLPALDPPHLPTMPMPQPDFDSFSRKRSLDYTSAMQPPTKRVTRSQVPKLSVSVPQFPTPGNAPPRLQPLDYSLPPTNPPPARTLDSLLASSSSLSQHQLPQLPQLPPPCTRSMGMGMVYSQQQQQQQQPLGASPAATSGPPTHYNFSPYSTRQTSPYSAQHSVASSPITPSFTQQQRSPTWILGNRESPYRPVRTVNTLLVPPAYLEAPQQIAYEQMHYQPLGKARSEYKTGVVPYMQPEVSWLHPAWSSSSEVGSSGHYYG